MRGRARTRNYSIVWLGYGPEWGWMLYGHRFGRLEVIGQGAPKGPRRVRTWRCRCDCGTEKDFTTGSLMRGASKSCGCIRARTFEENALRRAHPDEARAWYSMKARCSDKHHAQFWRYGGRGISVCRRWDDFAAFLADMGPRPSAWHSLDRIDNDGDYEPGNCRWATSEVQSRNRRGLKLTMEKAREVRALRGMSPEEVAHRFGVSVSQVYAVWSGRAWREDQ